MARSASERRGERPLGVRREAAKMEAAVTGPENGVKMSAGTYSFNNVWGKVLY